MRLHLITLTLLGCSSPPNAPVGDYEEVAHMKAIPNPDLDLLFVVDNSPSMLEEQTSLATNFPRRMDVLATLDGGLPNLHIGVVTSDMGTSSSTTMPAAGIGSGPGSCADRGDDGALVQGPNVLDRFISDIAGGNGTRVVNYTGMLRDAFRDLAMVGAEGCGFEQHLSAMQRALGSQPVNAGFLRPTANLAVVILADEDDCSATSGTLFNGNTSVLGPLQSFRCFEHGVQCTPDDPRKPAIKSGCIPRPTGPSYYVDEVAPFASQLVAVKGDDRMVMVAGIVGDPTQVEVDFAEPPGGGTSIPTLMPSCTYTDPVTGAAQHADPAVRIASFLDLFPDRSTLTSICDADLSVALDEIGHSAKQLMGDPCIDTSRLADMAPEPGVQPACELVEIRDSAPDRPTVLPPCDGAGDCYELVPDPRACPSTSDHVRLRIHRTSDAAPDTWTHLRCLPR